MPEVIAGTYEILDKIGGGGLSEVFLGWHLRLQKKIVLKADQPRHYGKSPESIRREVDALKNLSHSYIPQVYDFVEENGKTYTVMDFIEGESFAGLLKKRDRPFTQPQVIEWGRQLLEAVIYLHSRTADGIHGILHSDIKPANIMLTPEGYIRLIDFNIALAMGEQGAIAVGRSSGYASPEHYSVDAYYKSMGSTASSSGTPAAVSDTGTMPEGFEVLDSVPPPPKEIMLDARSDIYGVGATLYYLVTGRHPAPANQREKLLPLSPKEYSPSLARLINKAMSGKREERYQTAEEMLHALNRLREDDPRAIRKKAISWISGCILAASLLLCASATFIGLKQIQETEQELAYSESSVNALAAGDKVTAVNDALSALPERKGLLAIPYLPQARMALAESLGVYDLSDGFKADKTIELPSAPFKIILSKDGKTGAAVYAYAVAVFDTDSMRVTAALPTTESALADAEFVNDSLLAYAGADGLTLYDTAAGKKLWTGELCTNIAVSADGQSIAAVYKDGDSAVIYGIDGKIKTRVSFDGKKQRVPVNDTFANPNDDLLALNKDGSLLAASFADGSLTVYFIDEDSHVDIEETSDFFHFEGGFSGIYFAYSALSDSDSVCNVIDMDKLDFAVDFPEKQTRYEVQASEEGIFVSNEHTAVQVDPAARGQNEIAYTDSDIRAFDAGAMTTAVSTEKKQTAFYGSTANFLGAFDEANAPDFVKTAGDIGITAGYNSPDLRFYRRLSFPGADMFKYDPAYEHSEARVKDDGSRVMLFSSTGFRLYDSGGEVITEVTFPDADFVADTQFSKKSGNLAVLYKDALRIYSGIDGKPLFEETGLKSVFYAPYGVSVLGADQSLRLIDIDTGAASENFSAQGDFAAYCGMVVDNTFLGTRKLLGAGRYKDGYAFAVSDGSKGAVYDNKGKKLADISAATDTEAFFAGDVAVISPLHGTPEAISLKTGKKIAELEKDAYLCYITEDDGYIVAQYLNASDGGCFGMLLDSGTCQPVARLPHLTDILAGKLLFDCTGTVRQSPIYSIEDLKNMGGKYLTEG